MVNNNNNNNSDDDDDVYITLVFFTRTVTHARARFCIVLRVRAGREFVLFIFFYSPTSTKIVYTRIILLYSGFRLCFVNDYCFIFFYEDVRKLAPRRRWWKEKNRAGTSFFFFYQPTLKNNRMLSDCMFLFFFLHRARRPPRRNRRKDREGIIIIILLLLYFVIVHQVRPNRGEMKTLYCAYAV